MARESISELGDSLLAKTKGRNDSLYKRQRRDAWNMVMLHAGTSLVKNSIKVNTAEFMNRENVQAARVKQNQGWLDSQSIQNTRKTIDDSGMSTFDYFYDQDRPRLEAEANSVIREEGLNPEEYQARVSSVMREATTAKVAAFEKAYGASTSVQSPDDFEAFQTMRAYERTGLGGGLKTLASRMFGGKSKEELDQQTIQSMIESDAITKAETMSTLMSAYRQVGSLSGATKIAKAVEDGEISTAGVPIKWRAETIETSDRYGKSTSLVYYPENATTGAPILGTNGELASVSMPGMGGGSLSSDPTFGKRYDSITEGEVSSFTNSMQSIINSSGDENLNEAVKDYMTQRFGLEDGSLPPEAVKDFQKSLAVGSLALQEDLKISQFNSDKIAAQAFINDIQGAYSVEGEGWFDGKERAEVDLSKMPLRSDLSSVDIIESMASLEGSYVNGEFVLSGNAVYYSQQEAQSIVSNFYQDVAQMSYEQQELLNHKITTYPELYPVLSSMNPEGATVGDVVPEVVEEEVGAVTEVTDEITDETLGLGKSTVKLGRVPEEAFEDIHLRSGEVRVPPDLIKSIQAESGSSEESVKMAALGLSKRFPRYLELPDTAKEVLLQVASSSGPDFEGLGPLFTQLEAGQYNSAAVTISNLDSFRQPTKWGEVKPNMGIIRSLANKVRGMSGGH